MDGENVIEPRPKPPARRRLPARWEDLRWAWRSHQKVPYGPGELWSRKGREAHYRRWREAKAEEVRQALSAVGVRAPPTWSLVDLLALYEVLVEKCYDVPGFGPAPGGYVVDAGCGFGDFAVLAAASGPTSRVIAFDPDPENVRRTKELAAAGGLQDRVDVRGLALGAADGTARLGRVSALMLSVDSSQEAKEVPVRRLDSMALGAPVDLLKVDVEGMEVAVLEGAREILTRESPRIIVEVHSRELADRVAVHLRGYHYARVAEGPVRKSREFPFVRNEFWAPPPRRP